MSSPDEAQVSWKTIDQGAVAIASDGAEIGSVAEIAGDHKADIFDGLILARPRAAACYVAADQVRAIWEDRVELGLTAAEVAALPAYTEPRSVRWRPESRGGAAGRLRAAARDLFGRKR